jgi:hypothetical protein
MKLITPVLLIIAIATPCAAGDYPAACHDFTSFPRGDLAQPERPPCLNYLFNRVAIDGMLTAKSAPIHALAETKESQMMDMSKNIDVYVCRPDLGITKSLKAVFVQFELMDKRYAGGHRKTAYSGDDQRMRCNCCAIFNIFRHSSIWRQRKTIRLS